MRRLIIAAVLAALASCATLEPRRCFVKRGCIVCEWSLVSP